MKHYVIINEWYNALSGDRSHDILAVEDNEKDANITIEKKIINERKFVAEQGWKTVYDSDTYFEACHNSAHGISYTMIYIEEIVNTEE